MPQLRELDVSSYSPLQITEYDEAFRNCMPKAPLSSLTELKIDSLDQCCLLRHWPTSTANEPPSAGEEIKRPWRHLQIRDKHRNSRIHWTKFCSHHRDVLAEVQDLTLKVRAYWLSVPDPFAHFLGLRRLTLEFESSSEGLFQSLLATNQGRDWKERMPLPLLQALHLKNCDAQSMEFVKEFISRRKRAGRPLKVLSMVPFPGHINDVNWFKDTIFQFEHTQEAFEKC